MKKGVVCISILLALALASLSSRVLAESTPGVAYSWIGFTFKGIDGYYDPTRNIVAYKEGSTAVLSVSIYNNYTTALGKYLNVSAVKISFDWSAVAYSALGISTTTPLQIPHLETRTVALNFTIPSTSVATNLYLHSYTITVEHISSLVPPYTLYAVSLFRSDFAVYSTVQADAVELSKIIGGITKPSFTSTRANLLWLKSSNETATGGRYYTKGDFSGAKGHYETALDFINDAFVAEETYGVAWEELTLKSLESNSNMFNSAGTFMVLFGGALVLFSIGYVLKGLAALRKTSPSP